MHEHQLTETYSESFKMFLSHTNEKKVLLSEISKRIQEVGAKSLLDIGAGNGDLAIPLSKLVERYFAIEQKPDYVLKLSSAGISVIQESFPCSVQGSFDFILASHVLYWKKERQVPFVDCAIELLNKNGMFLIITYDDVSGDWFDLVENSGLKTSRNYSDRIDFVSDLMSKHGDFKKEIIICTVETKTVEEMLSALSFVWSDGKPEKIEAFKTNEKIREILETKYKNNFGYSFPFSHIFLEVIKNK